MSARGVAPQRAKNNRFAPGYHFIPVRGWINDPNGPVHFNGQWHLFYQYYEPSMIDGMQWGHAVSDDLAVWSHLEPAIRPDALGQIWSGSAVVDHGDTCGLFGGKPGLVCLFTYWDKSDFRQCQGMAYSADGLTFHTYDGNPVVPQLRRLPGHPDDKDFRDPKVFRHVKTGRWIMAVAGGKLRIFSSADLRVLLDGCSVELFAGGGESHMSAFILPSPETAGVTLFSDAGSMLENVVIRTVRK